MSRPNFATWLASTDMIEEVPGALTITVPNQYAKTWLENNIIGDIETLLKDSVENFEQVRIVVAKKSAAPLDDLRGSAGFRREMVRVCVIRALRSIAAGVGDLEAGKKHDHKDAVSRLKKIQAKWK